MTKSLFLQALATVRCILIPVLPLYRNISFPTFPSFLSIVPPTGSLSLVPDIARTTTKTPNCTKKARIACRLGRDNREIRDWGTREFRLPNASKRVFTSWLKIFAARWLNAACRQRSVLHGAFYTKLWKNVIIGDLATVSWQKVMFEFFAKERFVFTKRIVSGI